MATTDIATLGIRVNALEVDAASRKLKGMTGSANMATTAIKYLATGFVALKAAQYAKEAAMMAARYETLGVVMHVVGANAGYTADQMDDYSQSLRDSGIAMIESRSIVTRLTQAHIDLSKSSDLARIAQDAAVIGNMNSSQAFSKLTLGIQTAQVENLRTIGINVSFEESYKKLAAQLGKTAKELTLNEKTQARVNAVMESGVNIAGSYEASMGTAGKQILSMKRYSDDLKVTMGKVFNDTLITSVSLLTAGFKDANIAAGELSEAGDLDKWGENMTDVFATLADAMQYVTRSLNTVIVGTYAAVSATIDVVDASGDLMRFNAEGAKREIGEAKATFDAFLMYSKDQWGEDFASEHLARIRAEREKNAAKDKEAAENLEKNRMAASAAAEAAEELARQEAAAADKAKDLAESWGEITGALSADIATAGLEGFELEFVKINLEVDKMREAFGPEYSGKIDAYKIAMQDLALATELEANEAAKVRRELELFEENARQVERVTEVMDELTLASLSAEEQEKELISRQYDRLNGLVDQMVELKELAPEAGAAMHELFGQRMADDIDNLGGKSQSFMEQLQDGTAAWAKSYADNLNDMLWSSETTFDGILQSFGKMITEMLIQSAMVDLLGDSSKSGGSSGLLSQVGNFAVDYFSTPSAADGYDIPAGVNPMTQLHEKEMVLPAKYADTIRTMTGTDGGKPQEQQAPPKNDIRIINVQDMSQVGDYLGTTEGEQAVMNIMQKNGIR
jgi:hypothetical protein